ncbi:MAG TPA: MarR family transcriptional regulator [Umezawaea sp.]|nr:MarR family transcriptional regulator [Umezawaea sp.]
MSSKVPEESRQRRRTANSIKDSLRGLRVQLSFLNHRIGSRVALKDIDLDCLDLLSQQGPLSPTALSRLAGLHPATTTGVLDRLERGGWIARDRDPGDRRAVVVRVLPDRHAEVFEHYRGANKRMDDLLADYDAGQLEVIADFLTRATAVSRQATDDLGDSA